MGKSRWFKTTFVLLILILIQVVISNFDTNIVQAAEYSVDRVYGTGVECSYTKKVNDCPPGTSPIGYATSNSEYGCINTDDNAFCEEMTGNPRVFTGYTTYGTINTSQQARHCLGKVNYGSCSSNKFNIASGSIPPKINAYYKKIYDLSYDWQVANKLQELDCNNIPDTNKEYNHLRLPQIDIRTYYTDPDKRKQISLAHEIGFEIKKTAAAAGSSNEKFCYTNNSILMDLTVAGRTDEKRCYENIGMVNAMRPCEITLPNAGTNNTICIKGYKKPIENGIKSTDINAYIYSTAGIDDILNCARGNCTSKTMSNFDEYIEVISDLDQCKYTGREVMQHNSNKGCSSFTSYDYVNRVITTNDKYDKCIKCIYKNTNLTKEDIDLAVKRGVIANPVPQVGDSVNPNTEPYAQLKDGFIYSDLGGCINTNDTSAVVNTIIRLALGVMGGIVILRISQGVLTMQKADPESLDEGREIITSALIGLTVLILSAAILNFLGINILQIKDFPKFGQ